MSLDNIHALARAVIIEQGHLLLAYDPREKPEHYYKLNAFFYYLPGGHIEFKESAQSALLREIEEETGHKGQCERFLGILENAWSFSNDEICCHTHEINFLFKVTIPGLMPAITIPQREEHVAFKWWPLTELDWAELMPEALKTLLPEWLDLSLSKAFASSITQAQ